jgi:hypothetical protein
MGNAMVFDEQAYLAANPDVAAAIASGAMPSAQFHYDNHGQAEIASGSRNPFASVGAAPQPDYGSRYHEIRGVMGVDPIHDYTQTPVSTAAHKNPYHYVNSQTGQLNRDQLQQEIQSGAFRFNPDYYAAQNPDLAAAGLTSGTDLMNHFLDYGWNEGRNYAIENPNYTSDISNGFGGQVNGVNGSALPQFQDTLGGWNNTGVGAGAGGGASYDRNAFDPSAFQQNMQNMFNDWTTQFQQNQNNQYQQFTDQFQNNLWNTTPQSPTYAANSWQTAYNQSPTLDPVYQANNGGAQNGFQPTWNQSNPFSIRTF